MKRGPTARRKNHGPPPGRMAAWLYDYLSHDGPLAGWDAQERPEWGRVEEYPEPPSLTGRERRASA